MSRQHARVTVSYFSQPANNRSTRICHAGDTVYRIRKPGGLGWRKLCLVPKPLPNSFLFWNLAESHVDHDLRAGKFLGFGGAFVLTNASVSITTGSQPLSQVFSALAS